MKHRAGAEVPQTYILLNGQQGAIPEGKIDPPLYRNLWGKLALESLLINFSKHFPDEIMVSATFRTF